MKKILIMAMLAIVLTFGVSTNAMAEVSPTGTPNTSTTTIDKTDTSPKTGEPDFFLYGMGGVIVFAGIAIFSAKKLGWIQ